MVIYIDTTDFKSAVFAAAGKQGVVRHVVELDPQKSYLLASELEKFLKKAKAAPENVEKIVVCSGPGSYTGVRVGVVEAQALSFAWEVPLVAPMKPKFKIPIKIGK